MTVMLHRKLILLLMFLFVTGCSEDTQKPLNAMIYSPDGEPLNGGKLGKPTCEEAMNNWFMRVSANNPLTFERYRQEAQMQFIRMDIDHNGYLVSEELDRYREPFRQPMLSMKQQDAQSDDHPKRKGKKAAKTPLDPSLSVADPVMSADSNLDFKVTKQEFLDYEKIVFANLDSNHDNQLDLKEIQALCNPVK